MVTHQLEDPPTGTPFAMQDGAIVEQGSYAELALPALLRRYCWVHRQRIFKCARYSLI